MAQRFIKKGAFAYDVFLSHATEDKDDVARPLALALQQRGLRVWYDEFELKIGDNLVAKLNAGINGSRFGIIVLSQAFFAKQWTIHELNMLEYRWVTENHMLFPIWHHITIEEVTAYRAWLANIIGRRTDTFNVEEIAHQIYDAILASYAEQQAADCDEF
ncbi:MAG: toll/interleukin-1 receptor domain-containing protein [Chloroflexi bacterium]|nr:toll/interleukin-1 receptor domain-containing protein [Chloroflexota bacterium]